MTDEKEPQNKNEKAEFFNKHLKRMHNQLQETGDWEQIDDYYQSFGESYNHIYDYIKPFTKPIKIYLFKKRERLKMTIRVNDCYAMTYYWDQDMFEDMLYNWQKEWEGKARGMDMFIGPKSEKGGKKFVRITMAAHGGMEHRVSRIAMNQLRKDYEYQKNNTMPWDRD